MPPDLRKLFNLDDEDNPFLSKNRKLTPEQIRKRVIVTLPGVIREAVYQTADTPEEIETVLVGLRIPASAALCIADLLDEEAKQYLDEDPTTST